MTASALKYKTKQGEINICQLAASMICIKPYNAASRDITTTKAGIPSSVNPVLICGI